MNVNSYDFKTVRKISKSITSKLCIGFEAQKYFIQQSANWYSYVWFNVHDAFSHQGSLADCQLNKLLHHQLYYTATIATFHYSSNNFGQTDRKRALLYSINKEEEDCLFDNNFR